MAPRLLPDVTWQRAQLPTETPVRPSLGISQAPSRIVGIFAWQQSDGTIGLRLAADVTGDPVDVDGAGRRLRELAQSLGVQAVGYAPATDRDLARHFDWKGVTLAPISGQTAAAAAGRFVSTLEGGRLRWTDAAQVGSDLAFTVRDRASGAYVARAAKVDRPIPASLAAIYAVWLATNPADNVPTVH